MTGWGKAENILVGISNSGNSTNILKAFTTANEKKSPPVALTSATGGDLAEITDYIIIIPISDTPRIQKAHITVGHIICEIIESFYSHSYKLWIVLFVPNYLITILYF